MIKKISFAVFSILTVLFYSACEKIPDKIIDPNIGASSYQVTKIFTPKLFERLTSKNPFGVSIKFSNINGISKVLYNLNDSGGNVIYSQKEMEDNGDINNFGDSTANDMIYSAKINLTKTYQSGQFEFDFFVSGLNGNVKLIGKKYMLYSSQNKDYPPVISNLSMPDSVKINVNFVFSLKVSDQNGLSDIKEVYFELFRPDGSIVYSNTSSKDTKFPMFDNGDVQNSGDKTAGDGIYSLKNSFAANAPVGYWRFEFDKSDSLSNKIVHLIKVYK